MHEPLDMLHRELYHGITVAHLVGAVILVLVVNFIWGKLKRKNRPDIYEQVRCLECDWTGEVSKYHRVCRKCGGDALRTIYGEE